jgi:hypothetical protein
MVVIELLKHGREKPHRATETQNGDAINDQR